MDPWITPTPGYWGEVGVRAEVTATVTSARVVENPWGGRRLVELVTPEGHVLMTKSTAAWAWEAQEGDVYTGRATVQRHSEYAGRAQTTLTRASLRQVSRGDA